MFKSSLLWADQYSWVDYREPFAENTKVCDDKSIVVNVKLPDTFLKNHENITLGVEVTSRSYLVKHKDKGNSFESYRPNIRVNKAFFWGSYSLPVKYYPANQTHEIKIKSKYLQAGNNTLKISHVWRDKGSCKGKCCGFILNKLYFKDAPPLIYTLSVSSTPSGAKIYLDGEYSGTTPKNIEVGKGWHDFKLEKDGYYILVRSINTREDDEYSYALKRKELAKSDTKPLEIETSTPKQILSKDITPPDLIITSHDTSRGISISQKQNITNISGRATDKSGIDKIFVNHKEATVDKDGNFSADIDLSIGENPIVVAATDTFNNRATKRFTIIRKTPAHPPKDKIVEVPSHSPKDKIGGFSLGKYYALIIGNNNYKYIRNLETAKKDAQDVMDILKLQYGFKTQLLLDAKRNDIVSAINNYRKRLKEDDYFLIYYAGHGDFDKTTNKAYWLPVDAKRDDDTNWIIVDRITSNIRRISSKHILVVADSCYSGTFTRKSITDLSSAQQRNNYLEKMKRKSSRTLMASGGNEPVSDLGGKGHSVFAEAFISALKDMEQSEFLAEELFYEHVKERVAGNSDQTPEYNIIRNSGHDGGDFVFNRIH